MSDYAIVRNGELVREVKFIGEGLYREREIVVSTFKSHRTAEQVATVLNGEVVLLEDYTASLNQQAA